MIEHRIMLPDGRTLAATEVGAPDGMPVFLAHGFPGSRLGVELGAEHARVCGVRLIGFDRPGWGESDPLPGRSLSDWPADVAAAADALDCPRFNLLGLSGGMPFTLACAAAMPERVGRVGVCCGLGPPEALRQAEGMIWHNRIGLSLALNVRFIVRPTMALAGPLLRRFFEPAIDNLVRHSGRADRETLTDPPVRAVFGREFREAFRHGGAGGAADGLIYGNDWGFDLASIQPPVWLWHGEADTIVPVGVARWVIARMPGVHATIRPGEGHFSIVVRYLPEVLETMAGDRAC